MRATLNGLIYNHHVRSLHEVPVIVTYQGGSIAGFCMSEDPTSCEPFTG
jgi:hypothetical protein